MTNDLEFGIALREKRSGRNITQSELAKALGTTQERISRLESGATKVSLEDAYKISKFFGESVEDFINLSLHAEQKQHENILHSLVDFIKFGQLKKAQEISEENLHIEDEKQASILAFHSNILFWKGDFDNALHYAQKVKAKYDKAEYDDTSYQLAIMFELLSLSKMHRSNEAIKLHNEVKKHADEFSVINRGIFYQYSAWLYFEVQDTKKCMQYTNDLIKFSLEHQQVLFQGIGYLFKGWVVGTTEDSIEGLEYAHQGWELLDDSNAYVTLPLYSLILARIYKYANAPNFLKRQIREATKFMIENENLCYAADLKQIEIT